MRKGRRIVYLYVFLVLGIFLPAKAALALEPDPNTGLETPGATESPVESPGAAPTHNPGEVTTAAEVDLLLEHKQKLKITGFLVSATKDKAVKLSWDQNVYAKSYQIYRAVSKTGDYKLIKVVDQPRTDHVDTEIEAKKKYFYKIRAIGVFEDKLLEGEESRIRPFYNAGIFTPRISVKKGRSGTARYIMVELEHYEEKYVEIYISQNKKKFKKLKLVSNKIAKYKGQFKIKYEVKRQNIRFKVRTYRRVGKRKVYSKFSKVAEVRV